MSQVIIKIFIAAILFGLGFSLPAVRAPRKFQHDQCLNKDCES